MSQIKVKVKKLHEDAVIPKYMTDGASGFDLYALEYYIVPPGEIVLVRTGLAFEIPVGYELQIRPRSGVSLKTPLRIANSPGTIDSDYRGEVKIIIENRLSLYEAMLLPDGAAFLLDGSSIKLDSDKVNNHINARGCYFIRKGDRVAQGVIREVTRAEFEVAEELSETERGAGGFGHTGV